MHDGYLFTLGICGSANSSGPAPACLDAMLAALPPVKRAAYLGEVLLSEGEPSFDDPLLAPLLADIADAELLLLVTPLPGGALPPRLTALAHALAEQLPCAVPRFVALVLLGTVQESALAPLRGALAAASATGIGELHLNPDTPPDELHTQAVALAREGYARARALHPEALQ
jgi:hypothetical protein